MVMSDNGNAFIHSKDGNRERPLTSAALTTPIRYSAAVHQFPPPNDNTYHGMAKQNGGIQASTQRNDVESSIRLLHDLDDSMECVPQWFDDNLQIDAPYPTIERANALVSSGTEERRNHYKSAGRFTYSTQNRTSTETPDRRPKSSNAHLMGGST